MTYDELVDYCKEAGNEIIRQDEEIRQLDKENQQLKEDIKNIIKILEKKL